MVRQRVNHPTYTIYRDMEKVCEAGDWLTMGVVNIGVNFLRCRWRTPAYALEASAERTHSLTELQ